MAVQKFTSRGGIRVYGMHVETFPGHVNNIYLVVDGDALTLVDVGSGTDESIKGLHERFEEVRQRFGERISLDDVRHVVITHAHIDHFGWVGHFTRETGAGVVHELDARVLSRFEERIVLAPRHGRLPERAGSPPSSRASSRRCIASPRLRSSPSPSTAWSRTVADHQRLSRPSHAGALPGADLPRGGRPPSSRPIMCSRVSRRISRPPPSPLCGLELYLQSLDKVRRLGG